jgi:hypothetical protein
VRRPPHSRCRAMSCGPALERCAPRPSRRARATDSGGSVPQWYRSGPGRPGSPLRTRGPPGRCRRRGERARPRRGRRRRVGGRAPAASRWTSARRVLPAASPASRTRA